MRNDICNRRKLIPISENSGDITFYTVEPVEPIVEPVEPIVNDSRIFSNLSNRRITNIYYYYWKYEFKKRLRDKNHLMSKDLLNFIPVRWVFQYKVLQSKKPFRSKFLNNLNVNENISFITDNYKGIYNDNGVFIFKCLDLLFKNINSKMLNCVYIIYWLINNKKVRIILPISVYMELEKKYNLSNLIKNNNRISIYWDAIYSKNCLTAYESNIIDNNVISFFNHKIELHNSIIDSKNYFLTNERD